MYVRVSSRMLKNLAHSNLIFVIHERNVIYHGANAVVHHYLGLYRQRLQLVVVFCEFLVPTCFTLSR